MKNEFREFTDAVYFCIFELKSQAITLSSNKEIGQSEISSPYTFMQHNLSDKPPTPRSISFYVVVGPNPMTLEAYIAKFFAGMGLNTPDKIRAYDNFLRKNFNVPHYHLDITNRAGSDSALMNALKNDKRIKTTITVIVNPTVIEHLRSFGINLTVGGSGSANFTGYQQSFEPNVRKHLKTEADFIPAKETPISQWTTDDKLKEVIKRAAALLPESIGNQLLVLLDPLVIVFVVIVVVAWAGLHLVLAGQIIDVIAILLGLVAFGSIAYVAAEHLVIFATKTIGATSEEDLNEAAKNLSEAVALIGVQAVMQLLLIKAPKVYKIFPQKSFIKPGQLPSQTRPIGELFISLKLCRKLAFLNPEHWETLRFMEILNTYQALPEN